MTSFAGKLSASPDYCIYMESSTEDQAREEAGSLRLSEGRVPLS